MDIDGVVERKNEMEFQPLSPPSTFYTLGLKANNKNQKTIRTKK